MIRGRPDGGSVRFAAEDSGPPRARDPLDADTTTDESPDNGGVRVRVTAAVRGVEDGIAVGLAVDQLPEREAKGDPHETLLVVQV